MQRTGAGSPGGQSPANDMLSALLDAEERLAARVAQARDQASEMIRLAEAHAELLTSGCAAAIEQRIAELDSRHEDSLREELARIECDAKRQTAAYEAITGDGLEALVRFVVDEVLRGPSESAASTP
jgi:vacuolar-type H+-ATPase subunit H